MELLSWQSINDIVGDGGVIKTVVAEGEGWAKPEGRDEVIGAWGQAIACTTFQHTSRTPGG